MESFFIQLKIDLCYLSKLYAAVIIAMLFVAGHGLAENRITRNLGQEKITFRTIFLRGENRTGKGGQLLGRPWWNYSRVLLHFNLKDLQQKAFEYGKVGHATLTLELAKNVNPDDLPMELGALTIPWTDQATWRTSDGDRPWSGNIDDGLIRNTLITKALTQEKGLIEIDLTELMDAWLFQGLSNYGLLLKNRRLLARRKFN